MRKHLLVISALFVSLASFSQDIPENLSYTQIYDFIDELAIDRIISINSVVKPYSRDYIASSSVIKSRREAWLG